MLGKGEGFVVAVVLALLETPLLVHADDGSNMTKCLEQRNFGLTSMVEEVFPPFLSFFSLPFF